MGLAGFVRVEKPESLLVERGRIVVDGECLLALLFAVGLADVRGECTEVLDCTQATLLCKLA